MRFKLISTILFLCILCCSDIPDYSGSTDGTGPFISVWNTNNTSNGSSAANQISLDLPSDGTYDCTVDWGDGSTSIITEYNSPETTHTYPTAGIYTITITGTFIGFYTLTDGLKLLEIKRWGVLRLFNSQYYTNFGFFYGAANLKITATDILNLDGVDSLCRAFAHCHSLTTVPSMNKWNVSRVTDMSEMFWNAYSFNQNIGDWDVSNVTGMMLMFYNAYSFNQNIGRWNVSNVTDMQLMFSNAYVFNQNIGNWNVSKVILTRFMFDNAYAFNQDIGRWDVSSATNMGGMFYEATSFNQDLHNWDISSAITIADMFHNASSFNQDIGDWDITNVSAFSNLKDLFTGTNLSTANYDSILIKWSSLPNVPSGFTLDAGTAKYSAAASAAHASLINSHSWTINDGGLL
ncbi:MAG: BspA family leucine-rich repeat surface protein [Spirochaetes bacterium]|nr:BspA family leucine-rich repeat surface protein [Spirochaetota bacterium]